MTSHQFQKFLSWTLENQPSIDQLQVRVWRFGSRESETRELTSLCSYVVSTDSIGLRIRKRFGVYLLGGLVVLLQIVQKA